MHMKEELRLPVLNQYLFSKYLHNNSGRRAALTNFHCSSFTEKKLKLFYIFFKIYLYNQQEPQEWFSGVWMALLSMYPGTNILTRERVQ